MKLRAMLTVSIMASALGYAVPAAALGPTPAGWGCTGGCGTDTVPDGVVTTIPSGSPAYEWVSTTGGVSGVGQISGVGGTNGSLLTTPDFAAVANDPLHFNFNFITSDGAQYADYAWAALFNASDDSLVAYLFTARTQPAGDTSPGAGLPANSSTLTPMTSGIIGGGPAWAPLGGYSGQCWAAGCGYTGWIASDYTIPTNGEYFIGFGATNFLDAKYDTGLAIDGVTVNDVAIPTDTPEPASLVILASGLLGLRFVRRRRS